MRIASFDIFDTLLVRLVARPRDLFVIVGEELRQLGLSTIDPVEFATLRVAAESKAREPHAHRETTFDEIYAELAKPMRWERSQIVAAKAIELAAERKWIRTPEAARRKLARARAEAERIYFLSDMYLPREYLVGLLREANLWRDGDELIVSGETKCSKHSGKMFSELRRTLGEIKSWKHLGDNEHSDVRMAAQHAIVAEHFRECDLTRYELVYAQGEVPLWRSKAAGGIRYARLSAPESSERHKTIWDVAASVAGPLLFSYVVWVLEEALRRGLQRLYFISRDGQILLEIARRIIARWNLPIDARYLYGSRQAWRPAAGDSLDEWFRDWALAIGTPTNLRSIFSRLEIPPDDSALLQNMAWTEPLPNEVRFAWWEAIAKTDLGAKIIQQRRRKREIARRYLAQEGLLEDAPMAIVDIGWFGAMQRSLDAILADRRQPLIGFYFGMFIHPPAELGGDRMFAFWKDQTGLRSLKSSNVAFFERFTVATHGTVRGYREEGDRVVADLEAIAHEPLLEWGAEQLQAGILKATDAFLEVFKRGEFDPQDLFACARRAFELFSEHPSRDEAIVFGKMPVQDQKNEISAATLVPDLSEWEILRALLDYRRRPAGWWREGTLRARGSPSLWLFLTLRRWRERLRGRR
jgi:FMN phosphatase YigB (HAD superfamily)